MEISRTTVSLAEFRDAMTSLVGKEISRAWVSVIGPSIFLELGTLRSVRSVRGPQLEPRGESTVMVEWAWRVEKPRSIFYSSTDSLRRIESRVSSLTGKRITTIDVSGRLPELVVEIESQLWIRSFEMEERQPSWAVFTAPGVSYGVERGRLFRETVSHAG